MRKSRRHLLRRGSARNVMIRKHRLQFQRAIEIITEFWTNLPQFVDRQAIQFASELNANMRCIADGLVSTTKRYTFAHQVICSLHSIHEPSGRREVHSVRVELNL